MGNMILGVIESFCLNLYRPVKRDLSSCSPLCGTSCIQGQTERGTQGGRWDELVPEAGERAHPRYSLGPGFLSRK